jgi:hypothetical protein
LIPHLPEFIGKVWEPACGNGKMVAALRQAGFDVVGSDITQGVDFLRQARETGVDAIITNPRALNFDDTRIVAMLLRTDFDHAASRAHLFADCAMFAKKVVLTKRVRWFEGSKGSPSFNHCWMIWNRQHRGPPTITYDVKSTDSPVQSPTGACAKQRIAERIEAIGFAKGDRRSSRAASNEPWPAR